MPFDPFDRRRVGATKVEISRLGLGTAPLGGWPEAVSLETGVATVRRAWDHGIRFFDTAPFYGAGQSELFLGEALADKPRGEFRISTKTGRRLEPGPDAVAFFKDAQPFHTVFDFSAEGVEGAVMESRERLGVGAPDIVLVHDPDSHHSDVLRMAYPKLRAMRDAGHCILISSHLMSEVGALCDRLVIIDRGRAVAAGSPDDLRAWTGCDDLEEVFVQVLETQADGRPGFFGEAA